VHLEQLPRQVADRSVGVIGVPDHLHHMANRPLKQLDELGRRRAGGALTEFLDDRPGGVRPPGALRVGQKPSRAKTAVDLRTQSGQTFVRASRD
jgi:hypothetical protein